MKKSITFLLMLFAFSIFLSSGYALTGWQYYRDITIDNTQNSNTLTNYQVLVTIDTASLISAGKMNNDCSDVRFTEADGITELSYWIEDGTCNTANTRIWVKVPSIPASSSYTIKMWYGNPGAVSQSNGDNVFIFFDDFNDGVIDTNKWVFGGNPTEQNGILTLNDASVREYLASINSFGDNYAITSKYRAPGGAQSSAGLGFSLSQISDFGGVNDVAIVFEYTDGNVYHDIIDASGNRYRATTTQDDIYHIYDIGRTNSYGYIYRDGTQIISNVVNTANAYVILSVRAGYTADFDYVFVRAYTNPEPAASVGQEQVAQSNAVPIITLIEPSQNTYYGITQLNISFSVTDYDNSTIKVYAYLNGTEIYSNTAYTNNTQVDLSVDVKGYHYNITIVADDDIDTSYSEKIVNVIHGVNVTANVNGFYLTIEVNGQNTTYNNLNYKIIDWREIGNNTLAKMWVSKSGYDTDYKEITFYDSMGFKQEVFNIYLIHEFYLKDDKGNYIKDWVLTLNNTYIYNTNNYTIFVKMREITEGYYLLNATSWGYEYKEVGLELNNSYRINYTFNTIQVDIVINIYDEETLDNVVNASVDIRYKNGKIENIKYVAFGYLSDDGVINYDISNTIDNKFDTSILFGETRDSSGAVTDNKVLYYYIYNKSDILRLSYSIRGGSSCLSTGIYIRNFGSSTWELISSLTSSVDLSSYRYNNNYIKDNKLFLRIQTSANTGSYCHYYMKEIYTDEWIGNKFVFGVIDYNLTGEIRFTASSDEYVSRSYYINVPAYTSLSLDAYLLRIDVGRTIAFNIVNSKDEPVYNAKVSALAYINGAYRVVAQAKTDASATAYLFLKPEKEYYIKVEHPNYVSFYKQIIPYATSYRIKLSNVLDINFDNLFNGVSYALLPRGNSITDETTTFIFRVSSVNADIEYMKMSIINGNNILYSYLLDNSPGGGEIIYTLNITEHNITIGDSIKIEASFKRVGENEYYINRTYFVWYYQSNGTTLNDILLDTSQYGDAFKALMSFTIITLVVLGAVAVSGNVAVGMVVAVITTGILMAAGLMPFVAGSIAIVLGIALIIAFLR